MTNDSWALINPLQNRYGKQGRVIPFRFGKRVDENIADELTQAWRQFRQAARADRNAATIVDSKNADSEKKLDSIIHGDDNNNNNDDGVIETVDLLENKRAPKVPLRFGKRMRYGCEEQECSTECINTA